MGPRYRKGLLCIAGLGFAFVVAGCADVPWRADDVGEPLSQAASLAELREEAEREIAAGGSDPRPHVAIGRVLEAEGDLEGAEAAYLRALQIDPDQPTVSHDLAVLYLARGDVAGAERSLRRAVDGDPSLHGSRLLLVDVLAQTGAYAEARRHLSVVIEASPQGVDVSALEERMKELE